jgi:hypothetical protein
LTAFHKDFSSKENRIFRHVYRAKFSEKERDQIKVQWTEKMIASRKHILFFDFLQKYFPLDDNTLNVVKKKFIKEDKIVVNASHPPLEKILIDVKGVTVKASPFKMPKDDCPDDSRAIIEQNNFVNQSLHTIGQHKITLSTNLFILLGNSLIVLKKASPFKMPKDDCPDDSRAIIEQNNFVNQSLHTIGQHKITLSTNLFILLGNSLIVLKKASPFKMPKDDCPDDSRAIIEQNNFVNQSLHTIGQHKITLSTNLFILLGNSLIVLKKNFPLLLQKKIL